MANQYPDHQPEALSAATARQAGHFVVTPLPPKDEEAFLQQVRRLAALTGWRTYHTRNSKGSDAGFPDLVLVKGPRLAFVELKLSGKGRTEAQVAWAVALIGAGVEYHCWWPQDWDEIAACFGVEVTA